MKVSEEGEEEKGEAQMHCLGVGMMDFQGQKGQSGTMTGGKAEKIRAKANRLEGIDRGRRNQGAECLAPRKKFNSTTSWTDGRQE